MDDKTEELREIFLDVAEETTVTDAQRDERGSLERERDVEGELRSIIGEMRERYAFESNLDDDALVELVTAMYDGATDETIADRLEIEERAVRRARYDLHLVRDDEREAPFDLAKALRAIADGASVDEIADRLAVEAAVVRRHLRIHDIERRSRVANQRFRDAFDTVLSDAELSTRLVRGVHEDGLEEATEGLESNVSF